MRKLTIVVGVFISVILIAESCKKPPMSTGHKSFKQSKKNR
ncbi:MAG TPA: hypothetical protein VIN07_07005 [Flavipsychrobacter sp.]